MLLKRFIAVLATCLLLLAGCAQTRPLTPHVKHIIVNGVDPCVIPGNDSGAQLVADINACFASFSSGGGGGGGGSGQSFPPTNNLPMGSFLFTSLGAATVSGEALEYAQTGAVLSGLNADNGQITNVGAATAANQAIVFGQSGAQLGSATAAGEPIVYDQTLAQLDGLDLASNPITSVAAATANGQALVYGQSGGSIHDLTFSAFWGNACTTIANLSTVDPTPTNGDHVCVYDWNSVPGVCTSATGSFSQNQQVDAEYNGGSWQCSNTLITAAPGLNVLYFNGTDIGAKINSALGYALQNSTASCPKLFIPAGVYSFSTTIALPITGHSGSAPVNYQTQCRIEGEGEGNTILNYTGSGAAVTQVITASGEQGDHGAVIANLTLDGTGASAGAIGVRFGGSSNFGFENAGIVNFSGTNSAGVYVENANGMYTAQSYSTGLYLNNDTNGARFIVDSGGFTNFSRFNWQNVHYIGASGQSGFSLENSGTLDGSIQVQAKLIGTGVENALFCILAGSTITTNLDVDAQCADGQAGCIEFDVGSGATVATHGPINLANFPAQPVLNSGTFNPGNTFDVGFSISGTPSASQVWPFECNKPIKFPANFTIPTAVVSCGTNPSESDIYTVKVAGSAIGTVTLSTSCVGTFSTSGSTPQTCSNGQRLELDAPGTVSGANIAITLTGID